MSVIEQHALGLTGDQWQAVQDSVDTWNDNFDSDDLTEDLFGRLLLCVRELAQAPGAGAAIRQLEQQLTGEEQARAQQALVQQAPVQAPALQQVPPPPPPPPPPPAPAPAQAQPASDEPTSDEPAADEPTYALPAGHVKIHKAVRSQNLPLRKARLVQLATTMYYGVNREDMVAQIRSAVAAEVGAGDEPIASSSNNNNSGSGSGGSGSGNPLGSAASRRPGYKDSDGYIPVRGNAPYIHHWPVPPPGLIPVHQPSLLVFAVGEPGHAYTGIVRFAGRDEESERPVDPKIILFPTQATGDYLENGIREYPSDDDGKPRPGILRLGRVYQERSGQYTTHSGASQNSSHGKLSVLIEAKQAYEELKSEEADSSYQLAGMTIGFTVIKGGAETTHKYSFISRSSNNGTFSAISPREQKDTASAILQLRLERSAQYPHRRGAGYIPAEWGEKIIASVDAAAAHPPHLGARNHPDAQTP
jgi:hypothetical protein